MKICIFEESKFDDLYPLTLLRPSFNLRCGHTTLREKILRTLPEGEAIYFARECLTAVLSRDLQAPVNDLSTLDGDLIIANGKWLRMEHDLKLDTSKERWVACGDDLVFAVLKAETVSKCKAGSFEGFLEKIRSSLAREEMDVLMIRYPWDLIHHNADAIRADFMRLGKSGVEGEFSPQAAILGDEDQLYVAPGAGVQPFVLLDMRHGPIIIDEGAEIHPFSRIEGPAVIGRDTIVYGAKIREGTSVGPVCRVGGEVEESIIHGHSNKYHDGFLGHAYVCEWVNLGALTTNSDLKNDYSSVRVTTPKGEIDTGDTKVGCFIGDHTKTSIGTLFNTGTIVGIMSNVVGGSGIEPKTIPSFVTMMDRKPYKVSFKQQIEVARTAMGRRKVELTEDDIALLKHAQEVTLPERQAALKKMRAELLRQLGLRK